MDIESDLTSKVQRWNSHMEEKRGRVENISLENLPPPKATETSGTKRKLPVVVSEADSYHREHLKTAKRHIVASKETNAPQENPFFAATKTPANAQRMLHGNKQTKLIPIQTALGTMEQFRERNPEDENENSSNTTVVNTVTGESFRGFDSLEQMMDENMHYWRQRKHLNTSGAVPQKEIPRVSSKHIAKVLWQPRGAFKPCLAMATNNCRAIIEAQLIHPLSPNTGCMSYVTPEQYEKIQRTRKCDTEADLCEFCTRYMVNLLALRVHHEGMEIESEIAPRLYISGVPGEYTVDSMLQPITTNNGQKHAGVFGHFRLYNTADFVPVVGVVSKNGEISEVLSLNKYHALPEEKQKNCVFGWRETGPYHSLNECALLEDNQIDPYERIFVTTQEQLTVDSLLRSYFERRAGLGGPDYSHLFLDLMECVAMKNYLELPSPMDKYEEAKRFKYMCLHKEDAIPTVETHKIYYILLRKINACKALIKGEMKNKPHLCTKLNYFVTAHDPLVDWLWKNGLDDALLYSATERTSDGSEVEVLTNRQPRFELHYHQCDEHDATLRVETLKRPDPLEVLQHFYIGQVDLAIERNNARVAHLPILKDTFNSFDEHNTFSEFYTVATEVFENVVCLHLRTECNFVWPSNDKKLSKKAPDSVPDDKLSETYTEMMRAYNTVVDQMSREIEQYNYLLQNYGLLVFCPFENTVSWAKTQNLTTILNITDCFVDIFPDPKRLLEIDTKKINTLPWEEHIILFALLFRVWVLETLHKLEDPQQRFLRYQLVLLRNSHLGLFRCITENPHQLRTDAALHEKLHLESHPVENVYSIYDLYYPDPKREIHSGMLPNYGNGLTKVNFVTSCGMDESPWNKMQFKKPTAERCCNGREFHEMLAGICRTNKLFYRYTCLELELSFKGLYEHCTVVPNFARTVLLDELFDHTESEETASFFYNFILLNQSLVADATSESLCYLLDYCPALRDMLHNIHSNWFGWRAIANMDIVRSVFNTHGNFEHVQTDVYDQIQLSNQKSIYRHVNGDFTLHMCDIIRQFDIYRYSVGFVIPEKFQLVPHERVLIEHFVACRSPTALIELTDLRVLYLNERSLEVLWTLNKNFRQRGQKSSKINASSSIPADVNTLMISLGPHQYCIISYFFEELLRYQSIRAIRITNTSILRAQISKLCERFGETDISKLPPNSTVLAYSPCCNYVKNAFVRKETHISIGFDLVTRDLLSGEFRCAKNEVAKSARKNVRRSAPRRILQGGNPEGFERRVTKQQESEKKTLVCKTTRINQIGLIGDVIEFTRCKVPKTRTAGDKDITPPKPPFWIAPCCGRIINLDWEGWGPNGYHCEFCRNELKSTGDDFESLLCYTCENRKPDLNIHFVYDDMQLQTFRNIAFCQRCNNIVQRLPKKSRTLSAIICATEDINNLNFVSKYL